MINRIKRFFLRSEFSKNLATLLSGTAVAQGLPLVISPILTRLYSPEEFGVLALFMSVSIIFSSISSAKYELAVILPEKREDAINLVALGFLITSLLSTFLLILAILFHDFFIHLIGNYKLSGWLYFIPVVVFLLGIFQLLNYYNTRLKEYKTIAFAKMIKSSVMVGVQLILGFLKGGVGGLLSGYGISQIFGNMKLARNTLKDKELLQKISKESMKENAKRYKRFPIFTLPATFANKLSTDLTNVLVSAMFTVSTLGFYSLAVRMLGVPSSFLGESFRQVYFQEASDERKRTGKAIITFKSVVKKLLILGLPVYFLLFFIAEPAFAFIFGEKWRIAGTYAQVLVPLLFVRFVVSPVSISLSVFEKQHISLLWQVGLLTLSLMAFFIAYISNLSFMNLLIIYVSILVFYYLVFLLILYRVVTKGFK
jgi:O-antigen/teichoic acid export membrane protein